MFILTKQELSTVMMILDLGLEKSSFFIWLVGIKLCKKVQY